MMPTTRLKKVSLLLEGGNVKWKLSQCKHDYYFKQQWFIFLANLLKNYNLAVVKYNLRSNKTGYFSI